MWPPDLSELPTYRGGGRGAAENKTETGLETTSPNLMEAQELAAEPRFGL